MMKFIQYSFVPVYLFSAALKIYLIIINVFPENIYPITIIFSIVLDLVIVILLMLSSHLLEVYVGIAATFSVYTLLSSLIIGNPEYHNYLPIKINRVEMCFAINAMLLVLSLAGLLYEKERKKNYVNWKVKSSKPTKPTKSI